MLIALDSDPLLRGRFAYDLMQQVPLLMGPLNLVVPDDVEEQQERLVEQPETFSHRDLQELISDTSDRLDMGKTAKHLHGHVNLADNLALARQRRLQLSAPDSQPDDEEAVPADHSGNGKRQ